MPDLTASLALTSGGGALPPAIPVGSSVTLRLAIADAAGGGAVAGTGASIAVRAPDGTLTVYTALTGAGTGRYDLALALAQRGQWLARGAVTGPAAANSNDLVLTVLPSGLSNEPTPILPQAANDLLAAAAAAAAASAAAAAAAGTAGTAATTAAAAASTASTGASAAATDAATAASLRSATAADRALAEAASAAALAAVAAGGTTGIAAGQQDAYQAGRLLVDLPPLDTAFQLSAGDRVLLRADGKRKALAVSGIRMADVGNRPDEMVWRNGLAIQRPPRFDARLTNVLPGVTIKQGAAMDAPELRSKNLVTSPARIKGRRFCAFHSSSLASPSGDSDNGDYVVLRYTDSLASAWTDMLQVWPSDTVNQRCYDPMLLPIGLRLFLFFTMGTDVGYCLEIENAATATRNFTTRGPWFLGYGQFSRPVFWGGYWHIGRHWDNGGNPNPLTFPQLCRFHLDGPVGPWLEAITTPTDVALAERIAAESSVVFRPDNTCRMLRRTVSGPAYVDAAIDPLNDVNGGFTWGTPAAWGATNAGPGTRNVLAYSPDGNLIYIGHNAANRTKMTVWISRDNGLTFPYSFELNSGKRQYSALMFGGSGLDDYDGYLEITADVERLRSTGQMREVLMRVSEAAIIAGTASVTEYTVNS